MFSRILSFFLLGAAPLAFAGPTYPDWWIQRDVIIGDQQPPPAPGETGHNPATYDAWMADNYAVANIGQLKNFSTAAHDELDEYLAPIGGAGNGLDALVNPWEASPSDQENFSPANLGQLKHVTAVFIDRLQEAGYTFDTSAGRLGSYIDLQTNGHSYPWGPHLDDQQAGYDDWLQMHKQPATLGQLKLMFSWDVRNWVLIDSEDSGAGDGLPDYWEQYFFSNLDEVFDGDPDLDGATNAFEFFSKTNPSDDSQAEDPDNADSVVSFESVTHGDEFLEGHNLLVRVEATDTDTALDRVEFYVDDVFKGETGYSVDDIYSWTWYYLPAVELETTNYSLKAVAVDIFGHRIENAITITVLTDSDNDQLPDQWENAHFGDLSEDFAGDPDQDGATNSFEYFSGTDPNIGSGIDDPSNTDSVVTMLSPVNVVGQDNPMFIAGEAFELSASATDSDDETPVSRVEFYYESAQISSTLIASVYETGSSNTYAWTWHNPPIPTSDTTYTIKAVAVDSFGHRAESSNPVDIDIKVDSDSDGLPDYWEIDNWTDIVSYDGLGDPDGDRANNLYEYQNNTEPDVEDLPHLNVLANLTMSSPLEGDELFAGENLKLVATAASFDTSIKRIEFYAGPQLIGADYSPDANNSYSYDWEGIPLENDEDTTYAVFARAIDGYGHQVDSSSLSITVWEDVDLDSLPDSWEIIYFGDLDEGPLDDPDGDGANNLFEFLHKDAPFNAEPNYAENPPLNQPSVFVSFVVDPLVVWQGESAELFAEVSDNDTDVDRVEFYYDGNLIGAVTDPVNGDQYRLLWSELPYFGDGLSVTWISATAFDVYGHEVDSLEVTLDYRGDADGDRMQDDWEMLYFGDLDEIPAGDYDGDGYTNGFEHDNDKDPTDNTDPDNGGAPFNNPSVVSLAAPSNGVTVWEGESVVLQANATDSDSILNRVEFLVDGSPVGVDYSAANDLYTFNWSATSIINDGITVRTIVARVYDSYGHAVDSASITLNVIEDKDSDHLRDVDERTYFGGLSQGPEDDFDGDGSTNFMELELGADPNDATDLPGNTPPTILITSPDGGLVAWEGEALTLSAMANDVDSAITRVEFYDGGNLLEIDYLPENGSHYSITWSDLPAGSTGLTLHSITAKAFDAYGASATSAPLSISIQGDSDADGLGDDWEMQHFSDLDELPEGDPDSDNLINLHEYILGFDPTEQDSDFDTVPDDMEDRDVDGIPDGWELSYADFADYEIADADRNPDNDSLSNALEYFHGRHPGVFDADLMDIDQDNLLDSWEQQIVTACQNDPNCSGIDDVNDVLGGDDFDNDGFTNAEEYANGTDPTDPNNGVTDDPDADGLGSEAESLLQTNPLKPDNPSVELNAAPVQ